MQQSNDNYFAVKKKTKRGIKFILSATKNCLIGFLLILQNIYFSLPVYASTANLDFSNQANYTYDNTKISVSTNNVELVKTSSPSWYNENWKYRRSITIDNTGNATSLTNYQVKIKLNSSTFDFSKTQTEGQDIRFTENDGVSLLNYWLEDYSPSEQAATIWVKIPSITGLSTKTIYFYYGNSAATDAQNGDNTFVFFDDFSGILSTQWNKSTSNPVISSVVGSWESTIVGDPWVIYDSTNSIYRMWYFGLGETYAKIGYATSTDGVNWNKYAGNPILNVGSTGTYDDQYAHKPSVVQHNGLYYMFYVAQKKDGARTIALATSEKPEGPYTKYSGNPILSPLSTGYENNFLDTPSVMYDTDSNMWKMWYSCGNILNTEPKNWCYATSTDGYEWTKYANNPINTPPNDGSWYSQGLGGINIIKENGVYHNYFNAFDNSNVSRIGYTTSNDGITWTLGSSSVILDLGTGNSWDNSMLYRPNVQTVDGQKKLWYNAKGTTEQIGLATYGALATLDSTKWTQSAVGNCSIAISNGNLVINESGGGVYDFCLTKTASYNPGNDVIVETKSKIENVYDSSNGQTQYLLFLDNTPFFSGAQNAHFLFATSSEGKIKHQSRNLGSWGTEDTVYSTFPTISNWYRAQANKKSTGIDWYFLDDSENILGQFVDNNDSPTNFTNFPIAIGGRGTKSTFDWFRSRSYTSPEPSISIGNEITLYTSSNPTISQASNDALTFTSLSGFVETSTKNGGEIKYQLSNDSGTTWYWYNTSWTITNSDYSETNTASEINNNISTFPKGNGQLLIKAFLHSDGTQLVKLNSIDIQYSMDVDAPIISSISTNTSINTGETITWETNENSYSKIDYGLTSSYGTSIDETPSSPVQNHSVTISNLTSCSSYHYRIKSWDTSLNETLSDDNIFTTGGCTATQNNLQTTEQITATTGGHLSLQNGNSTGINLSIPTDFSELDANFQIHQLVNSTVSNAISIPSGNIIAGDYIYELKALINLNTTISAFNQPLTISINYSSADIDGVDESTLKIWRYDGTSWNVLSNCTVDTNSKSITCTTSNFSVFGLFGVPKTSNSTTSNASSSTSSNNDTKPTSGCNDQTPGSKAPWLYSAIAQNSNSILLYFTPADNPVDKYVLEYGTKPGNYIYSSPNLGINSRGQMTYLVKSLSPDTTYYFRVRGGNGCAIGDWSNEITATTKGLITTKNLNLISTIEPVKTIEKQDTKTESTPENKSYINVKIKVTDINNKPVKGASVTLHSNPQKTTTGDDGMALFSNVERGDHKIYIAYDDYKGEQSIYLTGDVEEYSINIKIKKEYLYISQLAYIIIGIMSLIIVILTAKLIKSAKKTSGSHSK